MPSPVPSRPETPAPLDAARATLARALARYTDPVPPSITDVRAAVASFVAEFRLGSRSPEQMVIALRACVEAHTPRRVAADERVALMQLLVRWAIEVHALYDPSSGAPRRERRAG